MKIVRWPDLSLSVKTELVKEFGDSLFKLCEEMFAVMKQNKGIGLAANQVGINKQIFVMKKDNGKRIFAINPRIIHESKTKVSLNEGCLSFPGISIKTSRSSGIFVHYFDAYGKRHEEGLAGIDAVCFQHELDHLNGNTFLKYVSNVKKMMIEKRLENVSK